MGEETKAEKKDLWSQIWVYAVIALIVIIVLFYIIRPLEEETAASVTQIFIIAIVAACGVVFLFVANQFKWFNTKTGQIAFLLSLAFFLWTTAESLFLYYDLIGSVLFPTFADVFYVIGYVPFAIALVLNIRTVKMKFKPIVLAIWIILSVGVFLAILFLEFIPFIIQEFSINTLTLIYPAEDYILLILVLVILLKFRSGEIAKPWGLLAIGVIFDAIGDIWYTYLEWYGLTLTAYDWYDLFFTLSYIFMFASGLYFLWLYRHQ